MTTKQLWDACRHLPCGGCGAAVGAFCTFTVGGKTFTRHVPCLGRLSAARKEAS